MSVPSEEPPRGWLHDLFHPPPHVRVEADVDVCGQVTVRAVARRRDDLVHLRVRGDLLAEGRGAVEWTGPLPLADEDPTLAILALAVDRTGPRSWATATVEASALEGTIVIAAPTASYAPQPVDLTFGAPGCADIEPATFAVHVDSGVVAAHEGLVAAGEPVRWEWQAWEGEHAVSAALTWRGWRIASAEQLVSVPATPFDADGDGVPEGADCDDHDPWSRPGLPEVAHDGRDNDCDGDLAGDADGDGFDAEGKRPSRLDPAGRAAVAALFPAPEGGNPFGEDFAERRLLAAPRLREPDCADKDASRFPWAAEGDDAVDHDCDGERGARGGVPIAGAEGADPGPRPASAEWLAAEVPERLLVLDPGDTDVLAFLPRGARNLRDLNLRVEVSGAPVWVELWLGGELRRDAAGVVLGPLAASTPAMRVRVAPGQPLVLPAPAPKKEGTWTGALWKQVGKLWQGDDGAPEVPGPGGLLATAAAAVWVTPFTVAVDLAEADAHRKARDVTALGERDVVYLRATPAVPGQGARARVVFGGS